VARQINLPVLIVLVFCIACAAGLGAFDPVLHFQKASASTGIDAYAAGNGLLLRMPHSGAMNASAVFEGSGKAASISYSLASAGANVTRIMAGGKLACAPCEQKKEYNVSAEGALDVSVFAQEVPIGMMNDSGALGRVFFERNVRSDVDFPVMLSVQGGWRASAGETMPSSFYGTDAPFHINRVGAAAEKLARWQFPWAAYTFASVLPAAAIKLAFGVSQGYAFKLWEILLFFLPVAVFYLFSRKLSRGADAVFLFSSLLYLSLPSQGMLVGGGADLFMYGMVAHTLATSLSLLCLLFAYEFVVEGKMRGFWLAALFCMLAAASNQRIMVANGIGLGCLLAISLPMHRARRALLAGVACAATGAWLVAPLFAGGGTVGTYAVLGGAATESLARSILGFFQLGYYALPALFAAGLAYAAGRKEMFLLFLFADCALVFVFASSPEVNAVAPFLDGLRFMPSFFLPVFFISGAGALAAFLWAAGAWGKLAARFRLDRLDVAVTFALAILLPLGALFASLAMSSLGQYSGEANSLSLIAEYSDLRAAYGIIGNGCAVMSGRNAISFYPVYDEVVLRTYLFDADANQTAAEMQRLGCSYLLFGSTKMITDASQPARWQEYAAFAGEARFEEIKYGGAVRLFRLREAPAVEWVPPVAEKMPDWLPALAAACTLVVIACGFAAGKIE